MFAFFLENAVETLLEHLAFVNGLCLHTILFMFRALLYYGELLNFDVDRMLMLYLYQGELEKTEVLWCCVLRAWKKVLLPQKKKNHFLDQNEESNFT